VEGDFAGEAATIVTTALPRLVDYQDAVYAKSYLARLVGLRALEPRGDGALTAEVARQLALAMTYEDTVRVAELKVRGTRFDRVATEVELADGQLLEVAEFFHPRTQEIADTLPVSLGTWLMRTGWARRFVDRGTRKGRVIKTTSLRGFLMLYLLARTKRFRRRSLRFAREQAAIEGWLRAVADTARIDYALGVEVAAARTLVKGYGETHERGSAKFDKLIALLPELSGRPDAAAQLTALVKAALADESGAALDKAIAGLKPPTPKPGYGVFPAQAGAHGH
jgi:indolepyruvate ferredoxin oxidoreductase beta subunit